MLWLISSLAVEDCQGWILSLLTDWCVLCTFWQSLWAMQSPRPQQQWPHPAPGKTKKTNHQLQPCKSQQTRNLLCRGHVGQLALSVVSLAQKDARREPWTQAMALYQFDIDVHPQEICNMINFEPDSELIPSTTQPNWRNLNVEIVVEPLEK